MRVLVPSAFLAARAERRGAGPRGGCSARGRDGFRRSPRRSGERRASGRSSSEADPRASRRRTSWPRRGLEVTLLESSSLLGGLAGSFDVQGVRIEKYYHFICRGDDDLVSTLDELGLSQKLHWKSSRMAYFVDGQLYPFLTPLELLRFAPLSLADRLRAGVAVKLAQRMKEEDLAPQKAIPWLTRMFGRGGLPRDLGAAHALQVRGARGRDQRGLDLGAHGAPVALAGVGLEGGARATSRAAAPPCSRPWGPISSGAGTGCS